MQSSGGRRGSRARGRSRLRANVRAETGNAGCSETLQRGRDFPSTSALAASETQQFVAAAPGGASDPIIWTLSPPVGTISSEGLYTAPAFIALALTVTVNAADAANPARQAGASITLVPSPNTTLRQAAPRSLLMGAAATADELPWIPDPLYDPSYTATLSEQYNMLTAENALKWPIVHPAPGTYNFEPADQLVAFANAHAMKFRGTTLCWEIDNPDWLTEFATTATPSAMAALLQDHIQTVMAHYRGQMYAWDLVNEAVSDQATGIGTDLRDSLWYNSPGIGLSGTGYIEQAFRWAHSADPDALLFYNDYGIEDEGPKFEAVYNMVRDFVSRGVPIHGVGFQMHLDTSGYPTTAGLIRNIERISALGLQAHITEMDVRLPVDSNGNASAAGLNTQAQIYQRILSACLQAAGCTAFQTWEFSDKYSWIPVYFPGFGAALPFDGAYRPKSAFNAMIATLQVAAPSGNAATPTAGLSY